MSVLDAMYEWMECMNIHINLNVSIDGNSNTDTLVGWLLRWMAGRHRWIDGSMDRWNGWIDG